MKNYFISIQFSNIAKAIKERMIYINNISTPSILMSIHKQYADLIYSGDKTLEIRKTAPFKDDIPRFFTAYLYETNKSGGAGMITGEFTCDCIMATHCFEAYIPHSCLSFEELEEYAQGKILYALHTLYAVRYKEPLPLSEFGLVKPPQSWQYVKNI